MVNARTNWGWPNRQHGPWRLLCGFVLAMATVLAGCSGGDGGGADAGATPPAPTLKSQPATPPAVLDGGSVTFSAEADGDQLLYQWQRNRVDIPGATQARYTHAPVTYADNGSQWRVLVSNGGGSVASSEVTLSVQPVAPTLAADPAAASVQEGQAATFSVKASGTAPISYQWLRNGIAIAGATAASYTLNAVALGDSGATFAVRVSNPGGTLTSGAAALTVQASASGPNGALALSGAGASAAGVGTSFVPTTAFVAGSFGPSCRFTAGGTLCDTSMTVQWNRGFNAFLTVSMASRERPSPGASPGQDVNGILVLLTLDASQPDPTRINFACNYTAATAGCDFAALGITVDAAARTLRFANTPLPLASGAGSVVFNGTLRW